MLHLTLIFIKFFFVVKWLIRLLKQNEKNGGACCLKCVFINLNYFVLF